MNRGPVQNRRQERTFIAFAFCLGLAVISSPLPAEDADGKPAAEQPALEKSVAEKPAVEQPAAANVAAFQTGTLIKITLPLTGNSDSRVKDEIRRYLKKLPAQGDRKDVAANLADPRPILVLELSPGQSEFGRGTDFGRAYDLANFISGRALAGVRTVAYIPRTIKGHNVLLAMACQQIVMAPDAEIGEAGIDQDPIDVPVRSGYTEIADRHKTIAPAVALGMLDKKLDVFKLVRDGTDGNNGTVFVLGTELDAEKKKAQILSEEKLLHPALYSGQQASITGYGFASFLSLAKDRPAMAAVLNLPLEAVRERPSGEWRAKKILLHEPISDKLVETVLKSLQDEIDNHDANFILLVIDTPGGSSADAANLANYVAGLDPGKVQTVAYILSQAPSEVALIALACDHIVLHKDATIGGPGNKPLNEIESSNLSRAYRGREGAPPNDPDRGIAKRKDRSWSLGAAMFDREFKVFHYTRDGRDFYFSPEEVQEQPGGADKFKQIEKITQDGFFLSLKAEQAAKYGVAETVTDYEDLKKLYGLDYDPPAVEPGWAITLIRALAHPKFAFLLLMIGGGAFLIELHSPGIGLGGFIAFLCFLVYFWGTYLNGTAGWLEFLLFVSGVVCLLIELFVIPGAAIFGLGGGLMILTSLIFASQTVVIPRTTQQFEDLRDMLVSIFIAGAGVVGIGILSRRFLHRAPGFNRMLLQPPTDQEIEQLAEREALVDYSRFLGKAGVTATPLAPAGKARFDGELIDVISRGEFIESGTDIIVADVQGNRVLVDKPEPKG